MPKTKNSDKKITQKKDREIFTMPKWMDCTWKRKPCGQDKCPICGRVKKDRNKHMERGEDPDSMEAMAEDLHGHFREALRAIKADAAAKGMKIDNIDRIAEPPSPHHFPLYNRVKDWHGSVYSIADESDDTSSAWLYTEAGEDLLWYTNTLMSKTYRQLANRWHIDQGDEYGEVDLAYTARVLDECLGYLKGSLYELMNGEYDYKNKFNIAYITLTGMENIILNI